jgi:hypothetical protein
LYFAETPLTDSDFALLQLDAKSHPFDTMMVCEPILSLSKGTQFSVLW